MKTEIIKINPLSPKEEEIKEVANALKEGRLVILPTETVYGLGADSKKDSAVERVYEVKKRSKDKPFSLAISDSKIVEELAKNIPPLAYKLMERFWPGPLTLVLESVNSGKVDTSTSLSANGERSRTIGLRMPKNSITLKVLSEVKDPIYLPSANISGKKPPINIEEALEDLDGLVDLAVDGGETELKCESTVIDLTVKPYQILREKAIKKEEIEKISKLKTILFVCTGNSCRSVMAKGLLTKILKDRPDIEILACGISVSFGLGASKETIELLKREGIDVSDHRAVGISDSLLKKSDLILVMERCHEKYILERFPQGENRIFLLREFAKIEKDQLEISDPIGRPMDFYERVYTLIKEAIERLAKII